jgi:hypothetical protein
LAALLGAALVYKSTYLEPEIWESDPGQCALLFFAAAAAAGGASTLTAVNKVWTKKEKKKKKNVPTSDAGKDGAKAPEGATPPVG